MDQGPQFSPSDGPAKAESLRLLLTAYPLLPVSPETCGGAEQVLSILESVLAARGYATTIAACDGSHATGEVFSTGSSPHALDQFPVREAEHSNRILSLLQNGAAFDVVHDHSGTFWRHADAVPVPLLATLHLPRDFYPEDAFRSLPANVFFNCVSHAQRHSFSDIPQVIATVRNGIPLERFPLQERKGDYLLWMGRMCREKGPHVAIHVARASGMRLVMAGAVYPFSYHREYFEREIRRHVETRGSAVEYIGVPSSREKYALLAGARALIISSLVDETSSLTAMEAMACGTPVVAFGRGALPEVIEDGVTGFLVYDTDAMAQALRRAGEIAPRACRSHVEANYSAERMVDDYEQVYARVLSLFRGRGSLTEDRIPA